MTLVDRSADFFDFGAWTYLNCAYHAPLPRVGWEALELAAEMRRNPAQIRNEYHFSFPDAYREAIGELIGCDPADVAVVDSTTRGMMVLVEGLDWQPGDEVVIPRGEFPANKLPWLGLARRGVEVRQLDLGDGTEAARRIAEALTPRTRVVAVGWVSYQDGRRLDLAAISELCRDRQVLLAVDGSQGIGGLPFDVRETPADLVACSGYKWLLGPYGVGFVYIRGELGERLEPSNINWFSADGAEDFNLLADLPFAFRPGARRFDANETASFFNLAPAIAAVRYLTEIGPAAIEAHCRALHAHLVAGLPAGFEPLGGADPALRSNILCLTGPDAATTAAAFACLRSRRVSVSSRENTIRVSPHVYNTAADIDRFLAALHESTGRPHPDGPPPSPEQVATETADLDARLARLLGR